jgi:hypothetical protein
MHVNARSAQTRSSEAAPIGADRGDERAVRGQELEDRADQ